MFHEQVLINAYKYPNDKACMNLKYLIVVCGINWCEHTFFYQLFFNLNFSFGGKHMLYFLRVCSTENVLVNDRNTTQELLVFAV